MGAHRTSRPVVDRVARIGAPLAVLAVGFALLLGERMGIEHELLLVAPSEVAPGGTLPARALLFDRIDVPGGPRRVSAEVELELVDHEGKVHARGVLDPSPVGAEGMLAVPPTLEGAFTLRAVAHVDGEPLASARAPVEITGDPEPARRLGRMASALQHFELGPVQGRAPPLPFEVRVASGACVPEAPCALLVHVGQPAASVRVEPSPSVTPSASPAGETGGIVRLPVVVHGPEARAEIVALRGGVEVGRRALQLPVALATPALAPGPRVFEVGGAALEARMLGERPALVADLYRDGAWVRTTSLIPGEPSALGGLEPGCWRVQVHADPFSSERSAVRTFVVREGERAVADALTALGPAPAGPAELRIAWAAAPAEAEMYALPAPVSGRATDVARLEARRDVLRIAALSALALGLTVAGVLFFRRGMEAAREAARVMDATGDPALSSPARRRRGLLSALLLVATLLLALLAAAALIIVRARLYE